ncbi:MAG: glycoside hydrolase family 16 protein [Victivallaceae bacterium]|nr:glycoside hydrolase family 16 protein [Victivallaceae bacterium]
MRKIAALLAAVIAFPVISSDETEVFKIGGHADSLVPTGKKWKLVWSDEFDGDSLDMSKWLFRTNFWGKPFRPFSDKGVEVKDGSLRLNLVRLPDGHYCSAQLQTGSLTYDIPKHPDDAKKFWPFGVYEKPKFMHKFGYYEIRCKLPKHDGWHSAFWIQAPGVGSHPNPAYCGVEVDVMETYQYHTKRKITGGPIWGGYGKTGHRSGHWRWKHHDTPDNWHYYGVNWKPTGYDFYIDGKLVGSTTLDKSKVAPVLDEDGKPCGGTLYSPVSWVDQFILITTECHGYRGGDKPSPLLDKAVLPDYFEVDHVRVFDDEDCNPDLRSSEELRLLRDTVFDKNMF